MKPFLIFIALMVWLPMAVPPSRAADESAQTLRIDQLKRAYLRCDLEANLRPLTSSRAMGCSLLAEHLLQQAFGGDLDKLLAWWRTARDQELQLGAPAANLTMAAWLYE